MFQQAAPRGAGGFPMDLSTFPVADKASFTLIRQLPLSPGIRATVNQPPQHVQPQRQAGMGVASLILAIISIVNMVLLRAVVAAIHATFPQNSALETPYHYLLGGWTLAIALIAVGGIVFGIGGLRQQNRKHSFATVGLCLNIAIPLGVMFFLLLMTTSESMAQQESDEAPTRVTNDSPAWRSPGAITLQCATIGMAAALITYSWKQRKGKQIEQFATHADLIACEVCRKQVPSSSKFCRRCGHSTTTTIAAKAPLRSPQRP
jgi:hypothetical protein